MAKRIIRYLTLEDRKKIEDLLSQGVSVWGIGAMIGVPQTTVHSEVKRHGGVENYKAEIAHENSWNITKEKDKQEKCLNLQERQQIESFLKKHWSCNEISKKINRGSSTINREVRLNGGRAKYNAELADKASKLRQARKQEQVAETLKEKHINPMNHLIHKFNEFKESVNKEIDSINQTLEIILTHIRNGDGQKN